MGGVPRCFFLGLSTRCAPVYTLSIIDAVLRCTLLEQKKGLIGSMVYSTDASKLDLCPLTGILSNAREIEAHDSPSSLLDTANTRIPAPRLSPSKYLPLLIRLYR